MCCRRAAAAPLPLRARAEQAAASLPPLLVAAERVASTVAQGVHGRRRVGQGETFWQFRQYQPGDAAARIDWRESAKSQRLYVRETEWEAAQSVWLWRDPSSSMDYSSAGYISGARLADQARPRRVDPGGAGEPPGARRRAADPAGQRCRADDRPGGAESAGGAGRTDARRSGCDRRHAGIRATAARRATGDGRRFPGAARAHQRRGRAIRRRRAQGPSTADRRPGRGGSAIRRPGAVRGRRGAGRHRDQPRRNRARRLRRTLPPSIATASPTSRGRSAGRSATTAPTAPRTSRCWPCTPPSPRTAGDERFLADGCIDAVRPSRRTPGGCSSG